MRLIKLKIKNIASLKGEHLIEFDEVTKTSSLFAITGETGSGKSTILNSIAMALYGRIYKTNVTQADIVTLGEREGHIQLIFSIKGEFYLADWKGKIRKPNGELLKQPKLERVIHKIEDPSFNAPRSTEVYNADELLNLNFDQFCKCIILNQGEFAKFLGSSFTERKAILEKLYPGGDIENISKVLKLELDQANSKINLIKAQLEAIQIAPDEGELLQEKQKKISNDLKIKRYWQTRYHNFSKLFESLEIYHGAHRDNKNRLERLALEIKETTHLFNLSMVEAESKLKSLEKATAHKDERAPLLHELIKKEEKVKILQEQNSLLSLNLKKLQEQKASITKDREEIQSQKNEWMNLHQKTLQSFHYSPDTLLAHKIELESYVDIVGKIEKLDIERKNVLEKVNETEKKGKELKTSISELESTMTQDPEELKNKLSNLKAQKITVQDALNRREVQKKNKDNLLERIERLNKEIEEQTSNLIHTKEEITEKNTLLKSLELTLSLHDYQLSLKRCVEHAKDEKLDQCPICHNELNEGFWDDIKFNFTETNIDELVKNHQKLQGLLQDLASKEILITTQKTHASEEISKLTGEINLLKKELSLPRPEISTIENEIETLEKTLIHFDHQYKELLRLKTDINQTRQQYILAKEHLSKVEADLEPLIKEQESLKTKLLEVDSKILDSLDNIKKDLRSLVQLTQEKKQGEALEQKLHHLKELAGKADLTIQELQESLQKNQHELAELESILKEHLQGKPAQEELAQLEEQIKIANADYQKAQLTQKNHEQNLSLKRGNVSSVEQLLKDYELKFIETLTLIRNIKEFEESPLREDVANFEEKLRTISLTVNDSVELILASKEFIQGIQEQLDLGINELNNEFGVINEKLSQWEKTQDRMKLLQLEFTEATAKVERYKRLSSILGTDELRTFALALVEENLILQTNEELANLCESRYEIIHQSRRGITPEFYILDKFHEGGIRKVSTLSGGETFMVSLAMALALAEMTRGQAEIDTLFIDEGFGTLDQESLEDVLEMLNQIQNRGLMIGIISHIKTLTHALPVNLVLTKAQDGTSKVNIRYN